jgi:hypothetical protein
MLSARQFLGIGNSCISSHVTSFKNSLKTTYKKPFANNKKLNNTLLAGC